MVPAVQNAINRDHEGAEEGLVFAIIDRQDEGVAERDPAGDVPNIGAVFRDAEVEIEDVAVEDDLFGIAIHGEFAAKGEEFLGDAADDLLVLRIDDEGAAGEEPPELVADDEKQLAVFIVEPLLVGEGEDVALHFIDVVVRHIGDVGGSAEGDPFVSDFVFHKEPL